MAVSDSLMRRYAYDCVRRRRPANRFTNERVRITGVGRLSGRQLRGTVAMNDAVVTCLSFCLGSIVRTFARNSEARTARVIKSKFCLRALSGIGRANARGYSRDCRSHRACVRRPAISFTISAATTIPPPTSAAWLGCSPMNSQTDSVPNTISSMESKPISAEAR